MSVFNTTKPTAAALADQIALAKSELTRLDERHAAMEAEAVAAAASPERYDAAAGEAAKAKAGCDAARDRLNRLRRAHYEARQSERAAEIRRIEEEEEPAAMQEHHKASDALERFRIAAWPAYLAQQAEVENRYGAASSRTQGLKHRIKALRDEIEADRRAMENK